MKGKPSLFGTGQQVSFAGTLLLSPKDKKRLGSMLQEEELNLAAWLRKIALKAIDKYEAKRGKQ